MGLLSAYRPKNVESLVRAIFRNTNADRLSALPPPPNFIIIFENYCRRIHREHKQRIEFKKLYFIDGGAQFLRQREINFINIIYNNCIS